MQRKRSIEPSIESLPTSNNAQREQTVIFNVTPTAANDVFFGNPMRNTSDTKRFVKLIRFALSGAIVGVALAGLFARWFGYDDGASKDIIGASFGFAVVMAFKILHFI